MNVAKRIIFLGLLLTAIALLVQARTLQNSSKPAGTGSIAGQVLVEGKPVANALLVLSQDHRRQHKGVTPFMKTTSDRDGNFKFEKVPMDNYLLAAVVPGSVNPTEAGKSISEQGKPLTVEDGEAISGIEISLKRGAVITGRVTDASNQPLIEAFVQIRKVDNPKSDSLFDTHQPAMHLTNDQGIYRFYGLPAGRYKVSVGQRERYAHINGQGSNVYLETFHPDETDQTRASIIELGAGEEVNGVDIKLGRKLKAYTASGRIIEAGTDKPVAGKPISCLLVDEQGRYQGQKGLENPFSKETGEFRIEGLTSGWYMIFFQDSGNTYGEPTIFEMKDGDVRGLELKARPAASVSGRVVIEGTRDPQTLALIQNLRLWVSVAPYFHGGQQPPSVAPDGSFKVTGLHPGKAHLSVESLKEQGIALLRVEHNGMAVQEFTLEEGKELTGIRVVLAYSSGIIRGTVRSETGKLPADVHVNVQAYRMEKEPVFVDYIKVDGLGRFVFQGLLPGDYELSLFVSNKVTLPPKRVSVTNDTETPVNFVVDFNAKNKDDKEK
jgi:hypothetical protein